MEHDLKKYLILILLAVSARPQIMAPIMAGGKQCCTFYVSQSTGSDSNPGTLALPWQTISKVNGTTLTAGQSVGFKAGDTWREQLTVPSAGSAGSPITFTSYGAGAQPVISAALIPPSWTDNSVQAGTTGNLLSANFDANSLGVYTSGGGSPAVSNTQSWTPAYSVHLPTGSNYITGTFASQTTLYVREYVYVAVNGGGSGDEFIDIYNGGTALYTVYLTATNFIAYFNQVSSTGSTTSCSLTTSAWHYVDFFWTASATTGQVGIKLDGTTCLTLTSQNTGSSGATKLNAGQVNAATGWDTYIDNVDVGNAGYMGAIIPGVLNTWSAPVTTAPISVFFNRTLGTGVGSVALCTSTGKWFWSGGTLYVYDTASPTSNYTSPGIEAPQYAAALDTNGKDFITISGLTLERNNLNYTGSIILSGNNNSLLNSEIRYGESSGVRVGNTLSKNNILISGNVIHDNLGTGIYAYQVNAIGGSENIAQNNVIWNNSGYAGFGDGVQIYGNYWIAQGNTIHDNGDSTNDSVALHIYATANGDHTYGQHNILRNNLIYNQNSVSNLDGSGIETDHGSGSNLIFGNVAYANQGPCIDIFESFTTNVYNNTCYGNVLSASAPFKAEILSLDLGGSSSTLAFTNNAVYSTGASTYAIYIDANVISGGVTFSHNIWYAPIATNWYNNGSGGNNLATWNALSYAGTDLYANPLFVSPPANVTLQGGSPAIGAGIFIPGVSTSNPPNIGAK